MRDRADSEDVIDSPAAARISERRPGRALSGTGNGPPRAFQAARVGGSASTVPPVLRLTPGGLGMHRAAPSPEGGPHAEGATEPGPSKDARELTDLAAIVASLRQAAARGRALCRPPGCRRCPHWSAPRISDSRTALQRTVRSSSGWPTGRLSSGRSPCAGTSPATAPVGGRHERQRKTSLLRLVAEQAARRLGPGELHLHADGGSGGLRGLSVLLTPGQSCPGTTTQDRATGAPARR